MYVCVCAGDDGLSGSVWHCQVSYESMRISYFIRSKISMRISWMRILHLVQDIYEDILNLLFFGADILRFN